MPDQPLPVQLPKPITTPIVINPSSLPAIISAIGRIVAILVAGVTAIMSFLTAHDLVGLYRWVHEGGDGVQFVATVIAVATFLWSLYVTWKRNGKLFVLALLAKHDAPATDKQVVIKS